MLTEPAVAERMVALGALRVRVRVIGVGSGPPLLCLNGLGAPLEMWEPLLRRLPGRRFIVFDAPGSGGSAEPLLPLTIGGHARLALDLLDHLGVGPVDVIGLSFGGLVAQELAHLAPDRVQRLILAAASCGWGSVPGTAAALLAICAPECLFTPAAYAEVARHYIGGREGSDRRFLGWQARLRAARPPSVAGYTYQVWAAAFWSSRWWLSSIDQPVLVLAGEADPLVPPANADLLMSLLPHARKHVVAGGGHLCVLDRAAELSPLLEEFLRRP